MKKKSLLVALLVLLSGLAFASDEVSIVVSSDGATKDDAIKMALRSAIEQTFGAFVSSNTTVLDDQLVNDEIVSLSSGNVKSYEILTENTLPNNRYYVTLRATICMNKLVNYINSNSKSSTVEVNMDAFDKNIRLAEMNKNAEESVLDNAIAQIWAMDNLFDYELVLDEPTLSHEAYYWDEDQGLYGGVKTIYGEYYRVAGKVVIKYNRNTDLAIDLLANTLEQIKMSKDEIKQYEKMGIEYYKINNTPNRYGTDMRELDMDLFHDEHKFGTNFPTNEYFFLRNKPGGLGLVEPMNCGFIFETHHRIYRFNSAFFVKKIDKFIIGDNVSTPTQLIVNLGKIENRYRVTYSVYCKGFKGFFKTKYIKYSVGDVIAECNIQIFVPKEISSKYKSFTVYPKLGLKQQQ